MTTQVEIGCKLTCVCKMLSGHHCTSNLHSVGLLSNRADYRVRPEEVGGQSRHYGGQDSIHYRYHQCGVTSVQSL